MLASIAGVQTAFAHATLVSLTISDNAFSGTRFSVHTLCMTTGGQLLHTLGSITLPGVGSYGISRSLFSDTVTYFVRNDVEPAGMGWE